MLHTLKPQAGALHGTFSHEYDPALTINPGDSVQYSTLDANWLDPAQLSDPPQFRRDWKRFSPRIKGRDDGHALHGPIAINGAQPGMLLAVHIERIVPDTWGWALPLYGNEDQPEAALTLWQLVPATMTGRDPHGHTVPLQPFMGVMGVAPAAGVFRTTPPYPTGGNLDCKELVAGSTLYLPVEVEGALFSVGDGHALQGDGEVGGTAIECPMQEVLLRFDLINAPDAPIPTLHAHTPAGWLTFGLDADLNNASHQALEAMYALMEARLNLTRLEAQALAGAVVDLRITQIVNETRGAHAILPPYILA